MRGVIMVRRACRRRALPSPLVCAEGVRDRRMAEVNEDLDFIKGLLSKEIINRKLEAP